MTKSRTLIALLASAAALFAACGEDQETVAEKPAVEAPAATAPGCSEEVPVKDGFHGDPSDVELANAYLEETGPPINASPCDAARALMGVPGIEDEEVVDVQVDPEEAATATVTITLTGIFDDSVEAQRWSFDFEPGEAGAVEVVDVEVAYRCQDGRGQQDFGPDYCV